MLDTIANVFALRLSSGQTENGICVVEYWFEGLCGRNRDSEVRFLHCDASLRVS